MTKKSGRPKFKPSDQDRRTVEAMTAGGIPHADIAAVIGICRNTLEKHFDYELKTAAAKANAKIAQTLYQKATGGDTTAMIWWSKARMRWSEKQEHEHSGSVINVVTGVPRDD